MCSSWSFTLTKCNRKYQITSKSMMYRRLLLMGRNLRHNRLWLMDRNLSCGCKIGWSQNRCQIHWLYAIHLQLFRNCEYLFSSKTRCKLRRWQTIMWLPYFQEKRMEQHQKSNMSWSKILTIQWIKTILFWAWVTNKNTLNGPRSLTRVKILNKIGTTKDTRIKIEHAFVRM